MNVNRSLEILSQEIKEDIKQLEVDLHEKIARRQGHNQFNQSLFQEIKKDIKQLEADLHERIARRLFW